MGVGLTPNLFAQPRLHRPVEGLGMFEWVGNAVKGVKHLADDAEKLAQEAWGGIKGASEAVAKAASDNWTKIAAATVIGGEGLVLNEGVKLITGTDVVDQGVKLGWDKAKGIVRWGENIANIPAGWINTGIKKFTPDSWDAFIDLAFPTQPVKIPTSWGEFKAQFQEMAPIASSVLSMCGPWGMAAAAAISLVAAFMRGASLEEAAWAAVEGATPYYIRMAAAAIKAVAKGGSVTQMMGSAVIDAAGQYFNNPIVNAAIDIAKDILFSGVSITNEIKKQAKNQLISYLADQGITSGQTYILATKGFDIIADSVQAVVEGKNVKDAALNSALDMGDKLFDPGSPQALGFSAAKGLLKGDKPTDVALKTLRKSLPADQLDGFDKAVNVASNVRGGGTVNMAVDAAVNTFDDNTPARFGADAAKKLISQGSLGDVDTAEDVIAGAKQALSDEQRVGFDVVIGMISRGVQNTPNGTPSAATVSGKASAPPSVVVFTMTQDELASIRSVALGKCPGGVAGGWCFAEEYQKEFNRVAQTKSIQPPPPLNTAQIAKKVKADALAAAQADCKNLPSAGSYTQSAMDLCVNGKRAYYERLFAAQYFATDACKDVTGQGHGLCMDATIAREAKKAASIEYGTLNCASTVGIGHGLCMDAMFNAAIGTPDCKWDSGFNNCVDAYRTKLAFDKAADLYARDACKLKPDAKANGCYASNLTYAQRAQIEALAWNKCGTLPALLQGGCDTYAKQIADQVTAAAKADCKNQTGLAYGNCMNARMLYQQKQAAAAYIASTVCKDVTGPGHGNCMDATIANELRKYAAIDYARSYCANVKGIGQGICMDAMFALATAAPGCKWDSGFDKCVNAYQAQLAKQALDTASASYADEKCRALPSSQQDDCRKYNLDYITKSKCSAGSGFNDCVDKYIAAQKAKAPLAPVVEPKKPFPWLILAAAGVGGYLLLRQK